MKLAFLSASPRAQARPGLPPHNARTVKRELASGALPRMSATTSRCREDAAKSSVSTRSPLGASCELILPVIYR